MSGLTKEEKEKLVVDLYYNHGKTYNEISKEARVSLRDIKPILEKYGSDKTMYVSSQAYKLFSEGKSLTDVAIALNLREPEASKLYREFWNLDQLYALNQIYNETKGNLSSFVQVYNLAKDAGMSSQNIDRLIRITAGDLLAAERICQVLKRKKQSLEANIDISSMTFQNLTDQISSLGKTLDSYSSSCEKKRETLEWLERKAKRLEEFINNFRDNNEDYQKDKEIITQEVSNGLQIANSRQILKTALLCVIESLRVNDRLFLSLFYNMPTTGYTNQYNNILNSSGQHLAYNYDDSVENYEKLLLEAAEKPYKKIVKDITNNVISAITSDNELPPLPSINSNTIQ